MKNSIIKTGTIAVLLFTMLTVFSNCSKDNNTIAIPSTVANQKYFEDTVLEHDLILSYATSNSGDISSQYSKYTFRFSRTSTYAGTIAIGNTDTPLTALWSIDQTYNNITISISPAPDPFAFLNDTFIFVSRTNFTLETLDKNNTKIIKFTRL